MDTERLAGRKALITGAAQGMGAATAKNWAAQGASVCLADLNEDGVKQVAQEIRDAGGTATHFKMDVTSEADAEAAGSELAVLADLLAGDLPEDIEPW